MSDWIEDTIKGYRDDELHQDKQAVRQFIEKTIDKAGITLEEVENHKTVMPQLLAESFYSIRKHIFKNSVEKNFIELVVYEYFKDRGVDVSESLETLNSRKNRSDSEHTEQESE